MPDVFHAEAQDLSEAQAAEIQRIKLAAQELWNLMDMSTCDARQMAVAKTNLEQSVMWATKAITSL